MLQMPGILYAQNQANLKLSFRFYMMSGIHTNESPLCPQRNECCQAASQPIPGSGGQEHSQHDWTTSGNTSDHYCLVLDAMLLGKRHLL